MRAVLDRARSEGARIRPVCTYVTRFLGTHTEYLDLLDEQPDQARSTTTGA